MDPSSLALRTELASLRGELLQMVHRVDGILRRVGDGPPLPGVHWDGVAGPTLVPLKPVCVRGWVRAATAPTPPPRCTSLCSCTCRRGRLRRASCPRRACFQPPAASYRRRRRRSGPPIRAPLTPPYGPSGAPSLPHDPFTRSGPAGGGDHGPAGPATDSARRPGPSPPATGGRPLRLPHAAGQRSPLWLLQSPDHGHHASLGTEGAIAVSL